jgi:hypothetical protein
LSWKSGAAVFLLLMTIVSSILALTGWFQFLRRGSIRPARRSAYQDYRRLKAPDGSEVKAFEPSYVFTYSAEINMILDATDLAYTTPALAFGSSKYRVPSIVDPFWLHILREKKRSNVNEPKIRLITDIDPHVLQRREPVALQYTSYFMSLFTNEQSDHDIYDAGNNLVHEGRRYIADSNNRILRLDESSASNHIGVSSLIITKDAHVVLQVQGRQQEGSFLEGPSSSGSADWWDIQEARYLGRGQTLQSLVRYSMERELFEEVQAMPFVPASNTKTLITGYARYLNRGGKPEFFGLTLINQDHRSFRTGERKVQKVSCVPLAAADSPAVLKYLSSKEKLIIENSNSSSLSLYLTVKFAKDFLSRQTTDVIAAHFHMN